MEQLFTVIEHHGAIALALFLALVMIIDAFKGN
jgi:hypothetical protein